MYSLFICMNLSKKRSCANCHLHTQIFISKYSKPFWIVITLFRWIGKETDIFLPHPPA